MGISNKMDCYMVMHHVLPSSHCFTTMKEYTHTHRHTWLYIPTQMGYVQLLLNLTSFLVAAFASLTVLQSDPTDLLLKPMRFIVATITKAKKAKLLIKTSV